jgi:membrane carboxypeptidase/penicillin-binding protein
LLAVVWVGYDEAYPLGLTGAQAALPIWLDFMKETLMGRPSEEFQPPPGVLQVTVDPASGDIAHAGCPTPTTEIFIAGTEPKAFCSLHGAAPVAGRATSVPGRGALREWLAPSRERPEASLP